MSSRELSARFTDIEAVARGGMGLVEEASDAVLGRRVAIKTLRSEFHDDERAISKFVEEARITGQLEHPNVVPIYDLAEGREHPYIVMRLVQGQSLTRLLDEAKTPSTTAETAELLRRLVGILLRLCDALAFAHGRGVFHCDVKPDNIMVGDHGQVYMMDWGVALTDKPREAFAGTAAYMAPEQLLGRIQDIDARTDVFGLGGVLLQILTGHPPNDGADVLAAGRARAARRLTPRALWASLPPELCRIALKALSPSREDRYPTVAAFREELEQFLRGGGWFDTLTVEPGTAIVTEGEPGSTAYIIQSGSCEVWKGPQGQRRLVRRLGAGDVFGEAAVFTGAPRSASIIAVTEVTLRCITGEALNRELDQNPVLAAFVRSLASLFRETDAALSARDSAPPDTK